MKKEQVDRRWYWSRPEIAETPDSAGILGLQDQPETGEKEAFQVKKSKRYLAQRQRRIEKRLD
ncbi:MAG: hypothetical protein ACE1ZI_06710, partial [Acidobacteriota bacterium]